MLNKIINRNKAKPKLTSIFKYENKDISDPLEITNRFCNYFTNLGLNLSADSHLKPKPFLSRRVWDSIFVIVYPKKK